jgi:hypothetical protein
MHHARYATDVVVATAYETDQSLPGILPQYSYTSEFGSALLEVGIRRRPLLVQLAQVGREVEIVFDESKSVVFLGRNRGRIGWGRSRKGGGNRWVGCAVVEVVGILAEGKYATVKGH